MIVLNSASTFFAGFLINIIYFIIILINNKFIENNLQKIGLTFQDLQQVFLFELSGVLSASIILVIFNNIIKTKYILIFSISIYFFSTLCIIFVDNEEVGKMFFYALYTCGYALIGFIILSNLLSFSKNSNIKILQISLIGLAIYLTINQYFKQIIYFINLDFFELIIAEMLLVSVIIIFDNIIVKAQKENFLKQKIIYNEINFSVISNFIKMELLTGFFIFLIISILIVKYSKLFKDKILIIHLNENLQEIYSIIFLITISSFILHNKINIKKLNALFLFCLLPCLYIFINQKIYSNLIILYWGCLIALFYNIIAANLFLITKKFEGDNGVLAILLYCTACSFGFYNGFIITISQIYNYFESHLSYSIYFVIFSLLVYHLYILNRHRIYK